MLKRQKSSVMAAEGESRYTQSMSKAKSEFVGSLYQRYWARLHSTIRGLVRSEDVAEDIAQDSFVRLTSMPEPETLEFPYAYLYRTALNLVKDRAKARRIRVQHRETFPENEQDNIEILSPEHHAMARQKLKVMTQAIEELPPKCRRVFLLHKVHGLSHKEIASVLGISGHAVEKHIMRALARCQAVYEKEVGEP